jgi:flagellin FlaB
MEEEKEKKAAQGIGTLIIFIALILVAAVAAGVLIQTAASLQSKSLDIGRASQTKITTDLEVTQVYVYDTSDGKINGGTDNLTIAVRLGTGSSSIKLSDMLIRLDSTDSSRPITYVVNTSASGPSETRYAVDYLLNGTQNVFGYIAPGDMVQFSMTVPSDVNMSEGSRLIVRVVPKDGAIKPVDMHLPPAITESVTYLYP